MKSYEYEEYDKAHKEERRKHIGYYSNKEDYHSKCNMKILGNPSSDEEDYSFFRWRPFDDTEKRMVREYLVGKERPYLPIRTIALSENESPDSDDEDYFVSESDPLIKQQILLDQQRKERVKKVVVFGSVLTLALLL